MRFVRDLAAPVCGAAVLCVGLLWILITVLDLDAPQLTETTTLPPAPRAAPARDFPLEYPAAPIPDPAAKPKSPVVEAEQRQRTAVLERDVATYQALQRNCIVATRNNTNGEYPALQKLACGRLEQFANEKGWDPKPQISEKSLTEPSTARLLVPDTSGR